MHSIRKCLLISNLNLLICSAFLLTISRKTINEFDIYNDILSLRYYIPPILGYVCASLLLLSAILGFCSTIGLRNYCLIITFIAMLILVLIFEICLGIITLVIRSEHHTILEQDMWASLKLYISGQRNIQKKWDLLQSNFYCCGIYSYANWLQILKEKFNNSINLPLSCCQILGAIGEANCTIDSLKQRDGCKLHLGSKIDLSLNVFGITALVFTGIILLKILYICYIARRIRIRSQQDYSEIVIITDEFMPLNE